MSDNILEIQNIEKSYAQHKALDDVSLTVPKGKIYGLLGPNGAGKTSLIRIVNQITGPDAGSVIFDGEPLNQSHIGQIGYLPEERGLYKKMKVGEQLLYLAQLKGLTKAEAQDKLKDWFIKFDIKTWWDKNVEDLSKGMQQKIQFVATVLHQPKLIILDEPFSGFDPINANIIKDEILQLRDNGSTIIFSTHRMESVEELCDYVALINKSKKVLEGKKADIKKLFNPHTFSLKYEGSLPTELQSASVLTDIDGNATLKKAENVDSDDILKELIGKVKIKAFIENEATMNDIFITAVQSTN